jgi:hypothetical protein
MEVSTEHVVLLSHLAVAANLIKVHQHVHALVMHLVQLQPASVCIALCAACRWVAYLWLLHSAKTKALAYRRICSPRAICRGMA